MSSTGQILGTVAGAVIGAFIPGGYVMLGASIGGMIGGAIDPPKGPKTEGPRLSDLSVQTSTLGAPIQRLYGTISTFGNIFYLENNQLKETSKTESQGGKGGGPEVTTYSYSATFALGLCLGPIGGVKRIWCSGKLIYDQTTADLASAVGTSTIATKLRIYLGTADQLPDPRMQASLGVANTPAYRGLSYIFFDDFPLEEFGNSLMGAQFKIEVCQPDMTMGWVPITQATGCDFNFWLTNNVPTADGMAYIKEVSGGVVKLANNTGTGQTLGFEVAQTDGAVITKFGESGWFYDDPDVIEFFDTWQALGRAADGRIPYVKFASDVDQNGNAQKSIIGYGGFVSYVNGVTRYRNTGGNIDIELMNYRLANGLPAEYFTFLVAYAKGDEQILVVTYDSTWHLIDLDGRHLSAGTIDLSDHVWSEGGTGMPGGGSGGGENYSVGRWSFEACHYDPASGILVSSTPNKMWMWYLPFGSTSFSAKPAWTITGLTNGFRCSVYVDGTTITHICGTAITVLAYRATSAGYILLSDLVKRECNESKLLTSGDTNTAALTSTVKGYKIAATAAIRSGLDVLQAAWPFDIVQKGYGISFVPRGGSVVATIANDDLGAVSGNQQPAIRIKSSREMDSQLPRRVEISYFDANREDDISEQASERLNTDAVNILRHEFPIRMVADEAAGKTEVLLYLYWLERVTVEFVLPPSYFALEPADVVTIQTPTASYECRLESINYLPDGRLECTAKFNQAAVYTPTAKGEELAFTGRPMTLASPCNPLVLDVPCLDSSVMNTSGLLIGLGPVMSDWPGGALLSSKDSGSSYSLAGSFTSPGMISGVAQNAISTGITHLVDEALTLTVWFRGGAPSTISNAAFYSGGNLFAYGAAGRWEIIAAQNVVANVDGSYTLSRLMRGRYGTEWAMSAHVAGDSLVLLDPTILQFYPLPTSAINTSMMWKGVTAGQDANSITAQTYGYVGENLECLSPVEIETAREPVTLAYLISWRRRSRLIVEPFNGISAPIGETSESYEVEIWDSTFASLKRTKTGLTTPQASYLKSEQDADGTTTSFGVKVFMISGTVGRGHAGIRTLVAPEYVVGSSLLHFNDVNGATTITDERGAVWTRFGTATISTAQSKFGGSSLYGPGQSGFSTTDSRVCVAANQPFTVEFFGYATAYPNDAWVCTLNANSAIGVRGGCMSVVLGGGYIDSAVSWPLNQWVHVAISREPTTNLTRWFFNGALVSSATFAEAIDRAEIGGNSGSNRWVGYVDEYLFEPSCLYTANFTPRTAQIT